MLTDYEIVALKTSPWLKLAMHYVRKPILYYYDLCPVVLAVINKYFACLYAKVFFRILIDVSVTLNINNRANFNVLSIMRILIEI